MSKIFESSRALATKEVNFRKEGIKAPITYLLMIDADNGQGDYKHPAASAIYVTGYHATAVKTVINDLWVVKLGAVLAINGTDATIGYKRPGTVGLRDTSQNQSVETLVTGNNLLSYAVASGDFKDCITNDKETTTNLNTGVTIEDAAGNMVVPGVGDLVLRVERVSGVGALILNYFAWIIVEEI